MRSLLLTGVVAGLLGYAVASPAQGKFGETSELDGFIRSMVSQHDFDAGELRQLLAHVEE